MNKRRPKPRKATIEINCSGKLPRNIVNELVSHLTGRFILTPKLAMAILAVAEDNIANMKEFRARTIKPNHLKSLSMALLRGNWVYNGDPIRFVGTSLQDGFHRCTAVVETQMPMEQMLCTDITLESIKTIDHGKPRAFGDCLHQMGRQNTSVFQAATKWIYYYENGMVLQRNSCPEDAVLLECFLQNEPAMQKSLKFVTKLKKIIPASQVVSSYAIFSKQNAEAVEDFLAILKERSFTARSPIKYLDKVLHDQYISRKTSKAFYPNYKMYALLFVGWNNWRNGNNRHPKWRDTEQTEKEPFPTAI